MSQSHQTLESRLEVAGRCGRCVGRMLNTCRNTSLSNVADRKHILHYYWTTDVLLNHLQQCIVYIVLLLDWYDILL